MSTVAQIISRVRRTFGDDASVEVADTDIIGWINEAMKELVVSLNLLQVTATSATVGGTSQYSLPNDILKLVSVKWQGQGLRYLSLQQAEESLPNKDDATNYPQGSPTHYWTWGGKINLYPAPASSGAADLTIYYNRMPVDVATTTDTPELPAIYHTRLIEYCLAQAHDLDDNIFGAELKMSQFQSNVSSMKELSEWEDEDLYPFITSSSGDSVDTTFGGYTYG